MGPVMRPVERVAFVSSWPISPDVQGNGFLPRYLDLLQHLENRYDVLVVYLKIEGFWFPTNSWWDAQEPTVIAIPTVSGMTGRVLRIAQSVWSLLGGRLRPEAWQQSLATLLQRWQPDVVVSIGDPRWLLKLGEFHPFPTVAFLEEDQSHLPENRRSMRARALDGLEELAWRRRRWSPAVTAVIGEREAEWARRRFPRSEVVVVPYTIRSETWDGDADPRSGAEQGEVLVVGCMDSLRNAAGLRDVVLALQRDHPDFANAILLVSHQDLHPVLTDLPPGVLRVLGQVDDLAPCYASAGLALVPSFIVSGIKSTIVQAWAAGCPVVTTGPAARASGATPEVDVLSGETPEEVARQVVRLSTDPELADRLAEAGRRHLRNSHSADAVETAVTRCLELASAKGSARPPSLTGDLVALASGRLRRFADERGVRVPGA